MRCWLYITITLAKDHISNMSGKTDLLMNPLDFSPLNLRLTKKDSSESQINILI